MGGQAETEGIASAPSIIIRHTLTDRLFHWSMAACVLVLLATAFLPILGIKFKWVTIHWVTGLVLTIIVLFHIIRAVFWQDLLSIWFGKDELKQMVSFWKPLFSPEGSPVKPGKYSPPQKLMHHAMTLLVLITIVTGLLMMVKVDTPLWERNPYWLSDDTWGIIYILHGISALFLITMIMIHIYFALRPEKLMYTRSMIKGWLTAEEFTIHHDPGKWRDARHG